jgi:hypothetical protein
MLLVLLWSHPPPEAILSLKGRLRGTYIHKPEGKITLHQLAMSPLRESEQEASEDGYPYCCSSGWD